MGYTWVKTCSTSDAGAVSESLETLAQIPSAAEDPVHNDLETINKSLMTSLRGNDDSDSRIRFDAASQR